MSVVHLAYLVAAVMFILGLKRLSSPRTARSGNQVAAVGMAIAVGTTFFLPGVHNLAAIAVALVAGALIGTVAARRVQMTQMPQMVALLNGLGGGAAALVSAAEYLDAASAGTSPGTVAVVSTLFGTVIGSISFTGSIVAFGKLQGIISESAITGILQRIVNAVLVVAIIATAVTGGLHLSAPVYIALLLCALAFGVSIVMPIGGADMPVVISLLNSCTGLAAAATGFVLANNALIISGTLVGASGTLLTTLMCKAMNRSIGNVIFAGVGAAPAAAPAHGAGAAGNGAGPAHTVRQITAEDAAVLFGNIQSLIIVPGYGMAVAQAQHIVRELADALAKRGVVVKYAVHPVAGRMPGHMNVLLAEANVPYDQLYDLDQINPAFDQADVALVIGANDVVNPAARTDRSSPIYGMPILDADHARNTIIIKRSLNPGFAGVDNPLYYAPRTYMLFGDAKGAVQQLVEALKNV